MSFHSLVLEVLHHVLHAPELRVQASSLSDDTVQLSPEVADVLLEQRLQVLPHGLGALLLQQGPLGVQDLVLLLQEPHLDEGRKEGRKRFELSGPRACLVTMMLGYHRACVEPQAGSLAPQSVVLHTPQISLAKSPHGP